MNPTYQKILVVDDHPEMRAVLSQLLETAGYQVRTATNGAEALAAVREECPYFVVTDWSMQPMDGLEFCRHLRQQTLPHYVYVVVLTVRDEVDNLIAALTAGADDFMNKPVRRAELLARLEAGARVLALEDRLSQLASSDPMTGVLNSRAAYQMFEREWCRSTRYHHPLSCILWDIDYFKTINDTYGHLVGDDMLRSLARFAEEKCRRSDYLCRWGGDEFLVILPETEEDGALRWAERCCAAIAATTFESRGHKLSVTASFGVAQQLESLQNPEQLLDMADQALYAAKNMGRRRAMSYTSIAPTPLPPIEPIPSADAVAPVAVS
jgi:two-component system, cell cycle response regulator